MIHIIYSRMIVVAFCVIILAVFAAMVANEYYQPYPVTLPQAAAVVISGCSSGIGLQTALHLADRKFRVYAGVRREEDIDVFESHEFITPIILDVTNTESIKAAVDFVANDLATQYGGAVKLSAVVNNAGIGYLSAVQEIDLVLFRTRLEINVIGALDLIQQFLPQLQENTAAGGAGRIVTVGSVSGFLATPLMGAYGASKHAMEALSDSLRMELAMYNISVSMVEPGTIVGTRIRSKRIRDEVPAEQRSALTSTNASLTSLGRDSPYEPYYSSQRERLRLADEAGVGDHPTVVAEAVLHAIESPFPRARYLVGRVGKIPSWVVAVLARLLPSRFMDAALLAVMMRS